MPSLRWLLSCLAFAFFFVVNPAYLGGCGSSSEGAPFTFGEAEMLALLEGANDGVTGADDDSGRRVELELSLSQVVGEETAAASGSNALMMRAHACESRGFYASAAACDVASHMPVEGTVTVRVVDGDDAHVVEDLGVEGVLMVNGHDLDNAHLEMQLIDGDGFFSLRSDGEARFELVGAELADLPGEALTLQLDR